MSCWSLDDTDKLSYLIFHLFYCWMCFKGTCQSSGMWHFGWMGMKVWWASAPTSPISPNWWKTLRAGGDSKMKYEVMIVQHLGDLIQMMTSHTLGISCMDENFLLCAVIVWGSWLSTFKLQSSSPTSALFCPGRLRTPWLTSSKVTHLSCCFLFVLSFLKFQFWFTFCYYDVDQNIYIDFY